MRRVAVLLTVAALLAAAYPASGGTSFATYHPAASTAAFVRAGSFGWVVGGAAPDGMPERGVWRYDPETYALTHAADLAANATAPAVAAAGGLLHVFNGSTYQTFNLSTGAASTPRSLAPALSDVATAVPLGNPASTTRFVLAGPGTWNGASTPPLLVDVAPSPPTVSALPGPAFSVSGLPPLVATPHGVFLFVGDDIYNVTASGYTALARPPVPRFFVSYGAAVWNGTHVLLFDGSGTVLVWRPPALSGSNEAGPVALDEVYAPGGVRSAAAFTTSRGEEVHFLEAAQYYDVGTGTYLAQLSAWTLAPLYVRYLDTFCSGTLACVLTPAWAPYPAEVNVTWEIAGRATRWGPTAALNLTNRDERPLVRVTVRDAIGRTATLEEPAAPGFLAPVGYVGWQCWAGNLTCHFDAARPFSGSYDPDGGTIAHYNWTVTPAPDPGACPQAASPLTGSAVLVCLGDARVYNVTLALADNLGLVGYWNTTLNATGAPVIVPAVDCIGLRCTVSATIYDGAPGVAQIATEGAPTGCSFSGYSPVSYWSHEFTDPPTLCFGVLFPANGTYAVRLNASHDGGPLSEALVKVTVENLAPLLSISVSCFEGTLRCTGYASAWDEEDLASPAVVWQPEPGRFVHGAYVQWNFTAPGIHRVRAHTTDANGWNVTEREAVFVRANAWSDLAPLPPSDGLVSVTGGYAYFSYSTLVLDRRPGAARADRVLVAWTGSAWEETLGALPVPVLDAPMQAWGDDVYVLGGDNGTGPSDELQRYDPSAGVWTRKPMPFSTAGAASAADFYGVYVLGGANATGPTAAVWRLDPRDGSWKQLPDLPWTGATHATALYGVVYAAGRVGESWTLASYSDVSGAWTPIASPAPLVDVRGLASLEGRVWVLAGTDAPTLRAHDPYAPAYLFPWLTWDDPVPAPRGLAALSSTFDEIVAFANETEPDGTRATFRYGVPTNVGFALVARARPLVSDREGLPVFVAAQPTGPGAFEELVTVEIWRPGESAPTWSSELGFTPARTIAREAAPRLPAGSYTLHVRGLVSGEVLATAFEVTSFWT